VSHGGVFRALAKMYGIEMWGVENCHLHEFIPSSVADTTPAKSFPWDVWHYDYEGELLRRRAESFYKAE
jgi:hypothetical protein